MHTLSPEIGNYTSFGNLRNLNPSNLVNSDFIWRKLCCFFYLKKFFLSKYQKGRLEDLSIICVCPSRCWFDEISLFFACFCCLIVCQFLSFCLFCPFICLCEALPKYEINVFQVSGIADPRDAGGSKKQLAGPHIYESAIQLRRNIFPVTCSLTSKTQNLNRDTYLYFH